MNLPSELTFQELPDAIPGGVHLNTVLKQSVKAWHLNGAGAGARVVPTRSEAAKTGPAASGENTSGCPHAADWDNPRSYPGRCQDAPTGAPAPRKIDTIPPHL